MNRFLTISFTLFLIILSSAAAADGQGLTREIKFNGGTIEIVNLSGRVGVAAASGEAGDGMVRLSAASNQAVGDGEVEIDSSGSRLRIRAVPNSGTKRIDLQVVVPERSKVSVETLAGEVLVAGDLEVVTVKTVTGTIATDVPTGDLKYELFWVASRPRFLADFEVAAVKEKSGGKFEIKGKRTDEERSGDGPERSAEGSGDRDNDGETAADDKEKRSRRVELKLTTERGIILLNVPPNEVSGDLRERPLTNAAKAIVRSGDVHLMEAIRRATPKYFGEYAKSLPPLKREPALYERTFAPEQPRDTVKTAVVRVTDKDNRAISGLSADDFEITEAGNAREIISVGPETAPFNLVLLLDVSGSVDNYVNFIRKAARNFVNTVAPGDRISIVLFNDDVRVLSGFTVDKVRLSESLDTFDAGGGTAFYDAVGYTLAESLRPLKGERTAVVVLTDGDDNRSFLPFDSLLGSIQESGALIYPLYVPSSLVAASGGDLNAPIDPLRQRYMTLNSKAEGEGEKLAKLSGGVYYPITQLSQIQAAYDDIVVQLRTAYNVKFRSSTSADPSNRPSPRLKIRVKKPNAFAQIASVAEARQ